MPQGVDMPLNKFIENLKVSVTHSETFGNLLKLSMGPDSLLWYDDTP